MTEFDEERTPVEALVDSVRDVAKDREGRIKKIAAKLIGRLERALKKREDDLTQSILEQSSKD